MGTRKLLLAATASLIGASGLVAAPAMAGQEDNSLVVAWGATGPISNLDHYFNTNRYGIWFTRMVWDSLVFRDPVTFEYKPLLATSWELVNDTTWKFNLRKGVKFHDGSDFTADDVAYTLNWIADPANKVKVQQNVSWIDNVEKVDDYTVLIHSKEPFPVALEYLSGPVVIYPKDYYSKVGPEGMSAHPIGTGPLKVESVTLTEEYVFSKNENYTWGSPKGEAQMDKVVVKEIADIQTQIAGLLAGDIDFTGDITRDQVQMIGSMPGYDAVQAGTMRTVYIGFDAAGRSDAKAMQNVKVRQAIAYAINRQAMVDALIGGDSRVLDTPCYPTQFGCIEEAAVKYEYNPEKAKKLLAEAGYSDGLSLDFYLFRPPTWAEAVMGDLRQVGIDANMTRMPYFALRDKQRNTGDTPMYMMDWGSYSINDASAILNVFFTMGGDDLARDEELAGWLTEAAGVMDKDARKELYAKAVHRITEKVYWLPMFNMVRNYAYKENLNFTPYVDEIPRFWQYGWKSE